MLSAHLRGKTAKKNFWIGVIVFPFRGWHRMMINNEERIGRMNCGRMGARRGLAEGVGRCRGVGCE